MLARLASYGDSNSSRPTNHFTVPVDIYTNMSTKTTREGIAIRNGDLDFTYRKDEYDDIITFFDQNLNHKTFAATRIGRSTRITVFFGHQLRTPETFNKEEKQKVNVLRSTIKNYTSLSTDTQSKLIQVIEDSIKKLNEFHRIDSFDMICSIESTAPLNKLLISKIKPYAKPDVLIVDDLFVKNNIIQNIELDMDMLEGESLKTQEDILKLYDKIVKKGEPFFIKNLKASHRRYFTHFLKFKDDLQKEIFDHILGHSVLLVDDTVGEISTFADMMRLLLPYRPSEYLCYAFLKDY